MPGGAVPVGGGIGENANKSKFVGILVTAFAAFGGILFGYDTGTISGVLAMPNWLETFGSAVEKSEAAPDGFAITASQSSLIVSILSVGTFFGALIGAYVADILGRKSGIIFATLIFSAGVAMQTASTAIPLFVAGRCIAGLGVGLISTLVPMYQSECAPKWIRGAVVAGYQWAITIGLLLASVINNATKDRTNHSSYRIPIAIQFIWAFVLDAGMLFLPESPRFLIKKHRDAQAAHAMGRLLALPHDSPEVEYELNEVRAALKIEEELGESSWFDCFKSSPNKIRLRTLTGIGLQACQQLTGVNFIFYYGTTFFKQSGIRNPFLISVATNVINVFMTIPGIWGVERFGRRSLLLVGAAGMCICEFLVAIIGVTISVQDQSGQKALIAIVCIYIAFFASTWGPIAWVVVGEIFPLSVRAKGIALSTASNWLWNWAIAYATPYLVDQGPGNANLQAKVFFIWGGCCFLCFAFTYLFIFETKGLSLEQVDLLYTNSSALTSNSYRQKIMAEDAHIQDTVATHGERKDHDVASVEKV
jgi:SP family sugar:H+ symporter-like MFS transporter